MRYERRKKTIGTRARRWFAGSLCTFIAVVAILHAALSYLPEPLAVAWWAVTFPASAAHASRKLEAQQLAAQLASSLPPRTYYFALNLNNNADVMGQLIDQLLVLAEALGASRIFVSVWENGSVDETPLLMARLATELSARGIRHAIVSDSSPWAQLCAFVEPAARSACLVHGPNTSLRRSGASFRIPLMAAIRNMALLPLFGATDAAQIVDSPVWDSDVSAARASQTQGTLYNVSHVLESSATGAATHLGFSDPTIVVFLNDVLFRAADVVELVTTEGGHYDLACAMDFGGLKLYDEWVARDLAGQSFSPWYPFVREPLAQARLRAGLPFRVFSCWNGAVAMPATAVRLFRSWHEGEVSVPSTRSLAKALQLPIEHLQAPTGRLWSADGCPVSECHILCKDLWSAGLTRIYMNPRARLVYDPQSRALVATVLPLAEALLLAWANRIGSGHHALRSRLIRGPVGRAASMNGGAVGFAAAGYGGAGAFLPPNRVSCGLSGVDDVE